VSEIRSERLLAISVLKYIETLSWVSILKPKLRKWNTACIARGY
jgi:hypothetical protein